jgi:uncharacterized protein (TIGR03663 family)
LKRGASLPESIRSDHALIENAASRWHWARWPAFFAIALIGLAVRLPQLGARPMHTDEAVNAYIVGQLLGGETFSYDPQDRHGPALAALALPLSRIQGAKSFSELTESELRLTSVVAGTVTILLFGVAVEMFGFLPSLLAALLFAVAPLPVYYDKYFIHESLFCAATFGLILAGWRACTTRFVSQAAISGACAALMFACKETAIIHFFAIAAAAFIYRLWNTSRDAEMSDLPKSCHPDPSPPRRTQWRDLRLHFRGPHFRGPHRTPLIFLTAVVTFLPLTVILFTWFGRNRNGLQRLLYAVPDVLERAGGQGHQKPFWYYGRLLTIGWSGGLLFALACLGLLISMRRRDSSSYLLLAYYAFFIVAIYSLIPYKTPWLALDFFLPLALFAARAVDLLRHRAAKHLSRRAAVPVFCILLALGGILIAHDTRQRVFLHPVDQGNPYAYAHTSDDVLGLPAEIADLAHRNAISNPRVAVIASDAWPLPWYLRHFSQVGFWQPGQQVAEADFYITSTEATEQYADQLQKLRPEFFGVRPGVLILLWSPEPK